MIYNLKYKYEGCISLRFAALFFVPISVCYLSSHKILIIKYLHKICFITYKIVSKKIPIFLVGI